MIATVDQLPRPASSKACIGRQALTPLDLERDFGLIGGDIFHGAMSLDQIVLRHGRCSGYADYRGSAGWSLSVRIRRASRRRRHRRAGS